MKPMVILTGPTAVGKTELSIRLAKILDAEIISADSMQVYKKMDIGTAKVMPEEMKGVTHYLVDCLEPGEPYSAAIFAETAGKYIQEENKKGKIPFLVGGTGMYIEGLLEGFEFRDKGSTRQKWLNLYEKEGLSGLIAAARKNPDIKNIPADKQRLIRTLELAEDRKKQTAGKAAGRVYDGPVIGITMERQPLYERINRRVDLMFEQGLEQEVRTLLQQGIPEDCQAFKGIGYKEVLLVLHGEITMDEARELIKKNTRHFAKRQLTWFRHMPYIQWVDRTGRDRVDWYGEVESIIHSAFSAK